MTQIEWLIQTVHQLTLHADYITDYLLVHHMLCVKELWIGSPYITTTHHSAHLLNLTHSG